MMRERYYEEPNGNKTILPAIIKPKLKRTPNVLRTRLLDYREGSERAARARRVPSAKYST